MTAIPPRDNDHSASDRELIRILKSMPTAFELRQPAGLLRAKAVVDRVILVPTEHLAQCYKELIEEEHGTIAKLDAADRLCTLSLMLFQLPQTEAWPLELRDGEVIGSHALDVYPYHQYPVELVLYLDAKYERRSARQVLRYNWDCCCWLNPVGPLRLAWAV